jgi:hypothetical protein
MEVEQTTVVLDGGAPTVPPQNNPVELNNLGTIVQEWRRLHEEISELNQQAREKKKRIKILEEIVLKTMKVNNIGALDLKNSGGRILYNKKQAKEGLNPKVIQKLLSAHMKSDEKAAEAIKYITENRESKTKETLLYEKE